MNNKGKVRVQAYISPYLAKRMDEIIEKKGFSSQSDFVRYAIQNLITKLENEDQN